MSNNLGDFDASAVVYGKFTTVQSTGAPFTLAGTPALSVYKDNSTTESTSGVTLTVDFDSRTGFNHFAVDTSTDGTFYSGGSFFDVVITAGTVNSISVVGYCVGQFTIRKVSALKPATAGRTLDVTATGAAGIDWGNVENPSTTLDLSGTTIKTATDLATAIAAIPTATQNATALLTYTDGIATGITPQGAWRVTLAAVSGKSDGFTGFASTIHYRDPADTKNVITANVDAVGNRSSVTLNTT